MARSCHKRAQTQIKLKNSLYYIDFYCNLINTHLFLLRYQIFPGIFMHISVPFSALPENGHNPWSICYLLTAVGQRNKSSPCAASDKADIFEVYCLARWLAAISTLSRYICTPSSTVDPNIRPSALSATIMKMVKRDFESPHSLLRVVIVMNIRSAHAFKLQSYADKLVH